MRLRLLFLTLFFSNVVVCVPPRRSSTLAQEAAIAQCDQEVAAILHEREAVIARLVIDPEVAAAIRLAYLAYQEAAIAQCDQEEAPRRHELKEAVIRLACQEVAIARHEREAKVDRWREGAAIRLVIDPEVAAAIRLAQEAEVARHEREAKVARRDQEEAAVRREEAAVRLAYEEAEVDLLADQEVAAIRREEKAAIAAIRREEKAAIAAIHREYEAARLRAARGRCKGCAIL